MALPFPDDPASPSAPNPYFPDNGFVRGDQMRANNSQIWANTTDLDERLGVAENDIVTIEADIVDIEAEIADLQIQTIANGLNTGGIVFNSSALPPSVLPGVYDIAGTRVSKTAQTALSLTTDVFKKSSQALAASRVYHVVMSTAGTLNWLLAMGPAVSSHTGNITSITQFSGTATLTAATGTISGDAGNIIVVSGTTQFDGVYVIATNGGAGVCTFLTSGNVDTGAVGTYTIYAALSVTSNANMTLTLNPTLNGYYLDANGVNGSGASAWRVLGRWFTDATPNTQYCVPFGNGAEQGAQFHGSVTSQGAIPIKAITTPPTKGTVVYDNHWTQQNGPIARMWGSYQQSGGSPTAGSGAYLLALPASVGNVDGSSMQVDNGYVGGQCGTMSSMSSRDLFAGYCYLYNLAARTVLTQFMVANASATNGDNWGSARNPLGPSGTIYTFSFEIFLPVVGYL